MQIRLENKDLKDYLMSQLQNQFIEDLRTDNDKFHKFYLYHKGECVAQGVMPKEVLLGTLYLGDGVSMYFESIPIEDSTNEDKNNKHDKKNKKH